MEAGARAPHVLACNGLGKKFGEGSAGCAVPRNHDDVVSKRLPRQRLRRQNSRQHHRSRPLRTNINI